MRIEFVTPPGWDGLPYVTWREGERVDVASSLTLLPDRSGLGYEDPHRLDRDDQGVLWARCTQELDENRWPTGRPVLNAMHPSRQRSMMSELRCLMCRRPARQYGGYLFLTVPPPAAKFLGRRPEGTRTAQPPICLAHVHAMLDADLPYLRAGAVGLFVRLPRLYGVVGTHFGVDEDGFLEPVRLPKPEADQALPYAERQARRWVLARQIVRSLHRVTPVDLTDVLKDPGFLKRLT